MVNSGKEDVYEIFVSRACILYLLFFSFEWICQHNIGNRFGGKTRLKKKFFFRQIISQVLGDLQFNFYHRWFDCIFLLSALFSIGILYLHYRSSQQSISLYDKNVQKVELLSIKNKIFQICFCFRFILNNGIITSICVCVCAVRN